MSGGKKATVWDDPKQARLAGWLFIALFAFIAHLLRGAVDFDGVLDTDVMNFGLAAFDFDVLQHQPHPPGYPGYVVFLKLIHALAPGLGPNDVAKWGARICGLLLIPAVYWTARQILGGGPNAPVGRPLVAAAFTVVHPVLWFYGADGQSHGAEALLTVVLFGAGVAARRRGTLSLALALVVAFGLSGSVRPTIPLLSSPILIWVFWGRPIKEWLLAGLLGAASVLAWYVPLVQMAGGLDLYRRATKALVGDIFIANYSIFGERSTWRTVVVNLVVTSYATVLAMIPFAAISRVWKPWMRVLVAITVLNFLFYTMVFASEVGYLIAIAGIACVVPAAWPQAIQLQHKLRAAAAGILGFAFVWFGPPSLPLPFATYVPMPTYAFVQNIAYAQGVHRDFMCGAADGKDTIVFTDNPVTTHNRWLPMRCPNIVVAVHLHDFYFNDKVDNWLIFRPRGMDAYPPPIPLEPGPPTRFELGPTEVIIVGPDATDDWRDQIAGQATCDAKRLEAETIGERFALMWPASCFGELRLGPHTAVVRSHSSDQ